MQDSIPCPLNEVLTIRYILLVQDSEGNRTVSSHGNGDVVEIVITYLMANTRYWYHAIATNQFGSSKSTPVEMCKSICMDTCT